MARVWLSGFTALALVLGLTSGWASADSPGLGHPDAIAISINDITATEGTGGTTPFVFTIKLSQQTNSTVTVNWATHDNSAISPADFAAASGTATFTPGVTTRPVSVDVVGDALDETNETFVVNLSAAVNGNIIDPQGVAIVADDDPTPTLTIDDVTLAEGDAGTTAFGFAITLSAPSGRTVTVHWATADGTATAPSDYATASGTATFPAGVTTQPVSVDVVGDTVEEGDETFSVSLTAPSNATIADAQGVATITDDDHPPALSVNDVTLAEGDTGTTAFGFTITLSKPSLQTVTVAWATADGTATAPSDYATAGGTATFTPGVTTQPVSVSVVGDAVFESDETFTVNLSSPTVVTIADGQGVGTITDDDPPPTIAIDSVTLAEGDAATTAFGFTITLSKPSLQTVTVAWATADGTAAQPSDYATAGGTATFTPGVTSQPVSVDVVGDIIGEPDEIFTVNLSVPVNATVADAQGDGTITNDDPIPTITSFSPQTVAVGKTVTISGTNLTGATDVAFAMAGGGTVSSPKVTVVDDATVTARVPALATTGVVAVTTPSGTASSPTSLTIKATVKTFTPASGPVGTLVTVHGQSFTGTTKVTFSGLDAPNFTVLSDTRITVVVPAGATTGRIQLTTPGGPAKSKTSFIVT